MEIVIGLAIGLAFFICTIKAYTIGLQHGKQLSRAEVPRIELNPVKAVKQATEEKETDPIVEGWNNIMRYDGTPQKEVIK